MKKRLVTFNGKKYVRIASVTGRQLTKIMVAICLIMCCTSCYHGRQKHKDLPLPVQKTQKIEHNSIPFSSEHVTETLHQGATGYCYIVYADIKEGLDNELLQVDRETFRRIEAANSTSKGKLKGFLIEADGVFTYNHERL